MDDERELNKENKNKYAKRLNKMAGDVVQISFHMHICIYCTLQCSGICLTSTNVDNRKHFVSHGQRLNIHNVQGRRIPPQF